MTDTMITIQAQRSYKEAVGEKMQAAKEKLAQVDWTRVTFASFFTGLGLFWLGLGILYFMAGGWYILFGGVFTFIAIGHFGMAFQPV